MSHHADLENDVPVIKVILHNEVFCGPHYPFPLCTGNGFNRIRIISGIKPGPDFHNVYFAGLSGNDVDLTYIMDAVVALKDRKPVIFQKFYGGFFALLR